MTGYRTQLRAIVRPARVPWERDKRPRWESGALGLPCRVGLLLCKVAPERYPVSLCSSKGLCAVWWRATGVRRPLVGLPLPARILPCVTRITWDVAAIVALWLDMWRMGEDDSLCEQIGSPHERAES